MSRTSRSESTSGWHDAMVIFDTNADDRPVSRSATYASQRAYVDDLRKRVETQLADHQLIEEVELDDGTAFNLLMVRGTDRAFECIRHTPGVERVVPVTDELDVELLGGGSTSANSAQRGPIV